VFPDLEIEYDEKTKFVQTDAPIIATSGGKTFMYIKNLSPEKTYNIELWRSKILKISESKNIPAYVIVNAFLYSADKFSEVSKATVEIDGIQVSIPVQSWVPACTETLLTKKVFTDAIAKTISSGTQYEEIVVLNENLNSIRTLIVDLTKMKDNDATLLISASPLSNTQESLLEEFMITTTIQGAQKKTLRSKELENNLFISQIDISKSNYQKLASRINYSVKEISKLASGKNYDGQCNMIRLSIKYIPNNKQVEAKECQEKEISTNNIKSVIPSLLPDISSTHQADEVISYEYTSVNFDKAKFKIDPFKPEQNKLKFTIKKASSFRFEIVSFPCFDTPIERSVMLKSVTKSHNKIMSETVASGIPNFGNSVILYVNELYPGNYELEIQYGWLKDYQPKDGDSANELLDVQVEIYSLYQDPQAVMLLFTKDRMLHQIENVVRDMSVINFIGSTSAQYLAEKVLIPTHPDDNGSPIGVPFKITQENAQVMLATHGEFTYLESIQILRKDSNSLIKRINGGSDNSISEILQNGEYILQFNYKDESEREHNPAFQSLTFGISSYNNVQTYKR